MNQQIRLPFVCPSQLFQRPWAQFQGGAEVQGGQDEGGHGWRSLEEEEVEQGHD